MKRWGILVIISFLVLSLASCQPSIEKSLPSEIDYGQPVKVTVQINSNDAFDLAELLPEGWEISSWTVEGNSTPVFLEFKEIEYKGNMVKGYHWMLPAGQMTLLYNMAANSAGSQTITSVIIYPGGFNSEDNDLFVNPICGNGICESALGENNINCPNDCRAKSYPEFLAIVLLFLTFMTIIAVMWREYKKYRGKSFIFRALDKDVAILKGEKPKTEKKIVRKKAKKAKKSRKR